MGNTDYDRGYEAGYRGGSRAKKKPRSPRCKVCGWGKLYAIHLPPLGKTEGAWGHEFVPNIPTPTDIGKER